MEDIKIIDQEKTSLGWRFKVAVGSVDDGIIYSVSLDKEYWKKLTEGKKSPSDLVKKSFQFLLKREPKESILKEFNVRLISTYFTEYEKEINK